MTDSMTSLAASFSCLSLSSKDPVEWIIPNIHRDDIHGLILSGDGHILSGSKDGSIVKSSLNGRIVARDYPGDARIDYTKWLTAICTFDSTRWLQGTRDGQILIRDNDLRILKTITLRSEEEHKCKERNLSRIMTFGTYPKASPHQPFFVGQATRFSLFQTDGHMLSDYPADPNDWVYVLHPLSQKRMIVVTGSNMAIWKKAHGWQQSSFLVRDSSRMANWQRPYISSLTRLTEDDSKVAYTVFDGSVRVLDLTTGKSIVRWQEHRNRVWSVVNCCHSLLASSADDRTVKLWDVRQQPSVCTFTGHAGRVSSLLSLDTRLVCATCPDNPRDGQGAALICRDVRGF